MSGLPEFLKKYFWDTEFEKIILENRRIYVLKRILEYGDKKAVAWMRRNFTTTEMKNALVTFRGYSQKSANYWAIILDMPREKIPCLKIHSSTEQKKIWPY